MTGYLDEIVPSSPPDPVSTQSSRDEIVGTIETLISPFVPMRGVTSKEIPQLKKASLANIILSSPGIDVISAAMSSDVALPPESERLAETFTFGYFVVMSTIAFLPLDTMIFGFEKVFASSVASSALSVSDI